MGRRTDGSPKRIQILMHWGTGLQQRVLKKGGRIVPVTKFQQLKYPTARSAAPALAQRITQPVFFVCIAITLSGQPPLGPLPCWSRKVPPGIGQIAGSGACAINVRSHLAVDCTSGENPPASTDAAASGTPAVCHVHLMPIGPMTHHLAGFEAIHHGHLDPPGAAGPWQRLQRPCLAPATAAQCAIARLASAVLLATACRLAPQSPSPLGIPAA